MYAKVRVLQSPAYGVELALLALPMVETIFTFDRRFVARSNTRQRRKADKEFFPAVKMKDAL